MRAQGEGAHPSGSTDDVLLLDLSWNDMVCPNCVMTDCHCGHSPEVHGRRGLSLHQEGREEEEEDVREEAKKQLRKQLLDSLGQLSQLEDRFRDSCVLGGDGGVGEGDEELCRVGGLIDAEVAELIAGLEEQRAMAAALSSFSSSSSAAAAAAAAEEGEERAGGHSEALKEPEQEPESDYEDEEQCIRGLEPLAAMLRELGASIGDDFTLVEELDCCDAFAGAVSARRASDGAEVVVKWSSAVGGPTPTRAEEDEEEEWSGQEEGDGLRLLRRESRALEYVHGLPGASEHVEALLHPYREVEVAAAAAPGAPAVKYGALVLEKPASDLSEFVQFHLGGGEASSSECLPAAPEGLLRVASALRRWEASLQWLHGHGVLHLDVKADKALVFDGGKVKLGGLAGIVTAGHSSQGDDPPPPPGKQAGEGGGEVAEEEEEAVGGDERRRRKSCPRWRTRDLLAQGVPRVFTQRYEQPECLAPGLGEIDFTADWWSLGVSRAELLLGGSLSGAFEGNPEAASAVVLDALIRGRLRGGS